MGFTEYEPGTSFPGVIGRTADESEPAWPRPVRAVEGSPNVVIIVLDDTGFGHLGCYGSPIATPNLDRLAARGLRYNNMHTTALCSPSRACIVTGRNHHSNAMACITEMATGYPGYNGSIPFENGFLSEMLLQHGYNTYMVGKYHLLPSSEETPAGPYDRWPLGRGFQRYYGFLGGDTSQWDPDLVYDNHQVEPPKTPEEGYHLTRGPRGQGDRVHRRRQADRPGQALLPPLLPGRHTRAPPCPEGVGGPLPRGVRRRLGGLPRARFRPPEGARHRAPGRGAVQARPGRPGVGHPERRPAPAVRPDDGGLRRVPVAHGPPPRAGPRLPREHRGAGQHPRDGGLRQRRQR